MLTQSKIPKIKFSDLLLLNWENTPFHNQTLEMSQDKTKIISRSISIKKKLRTKIIFYMWIFLARERKNELILKDNIILKAKVLHITFQENSSKSEGIQLLACNSRHLRNELWIRSNLTHQWSNWALKPTKFTLAFN